MIMEGNTKSPANRAGKILLTMAAALIVSLVLHVRPGMKSVPATQPLTHSAKSQGKDTLHDFNHHVYCLPWVNAVGLLRLSICRTKEK